MFTGTANPNDKTTAKAVCEEHHLQRIWKIPFEGSPSRTRIFRLIYRVVFIRHGERGVKS